MVVSNDSQEQELTQRQQRLQDFRTAKAITLGMQVYEKHTTAQVKPSTMLPIHRGVALKKLFSDIHKDIFKQWDYQAEDVITSGRQGISWQEEPEIRREFRENIDSIIYDTKKDNIDTAIFDSNGLVAKLPDIGQRLAKFYDKMRKTENFAYGNSLTLDLFTAIAGNLPEFKTAYPSGIDFRRLEQADAQAMHNPKSSIEDLSKAFTNALSSSRDIGIDNPINGFQTWPDQKAMLDGIPFLSYEHEKHGKCLVTVNGGLVKLEEVEE
ncbi:MAG: toxin, partial [Pseudomonadota bacterium]